MSVEAPQAVRCGSCGSRFDLSARNARAARTEGRAPICHDCRYPVKEDPAAVERYKAWWLERYSLEELQELGGDWTSLPTLKAD